MPQSDSSLPLSVLTALDEYRDAIVTNERYGDSIEIPTRFQVAEIAARAALLHSLREMAQNEDRWRFVLSLLGRQLRSQHYADVNGPEMYLLLGDRELRTGSLGDYSDKLVTAAIDRARGVPSSVVPAVDPSRSYPDAVQALTPRTPQPETRP